MDEKWTIIVILERKTILMQKTFWVICWFFAIITCVSCGYISTGRKQDIYNEIAATNDTLGKMTREWNLRLDKATKTKDFTTLPPYRLKMGQFLSKHRNNVANLKRNNETAPIIDSEVAFLSTQATIISDVYPKFEFYNDATPDDVIKNEIKDLSNEMDNETSGSAAIRKSLQAFANRNGLARKF